MTPHMRNLFEELDKYISEKNKFLVIENKAIHSIANAINIIDLIEKNFDPEDSEELIKRFLNSIRNRDSIKFQRGLKRIKNKENENK